VKRSLALPPVPSTVTVIKDAAGRYVASFIVETEPDTQVCSACCVKDGPKPLQIRGWTCQDCGTVHDRDINAARNIAKVRRTCGYSVSNQLSDPMSDVPSGDGISHSGRVA
jgi:transposase